MQLAYMQVGGQTNINLLEETLVERRKVAQAVGYQSWSDYQTDGRMAKNAATVNDMHSDLRTKLTPRSQADLAELLAEKQVLDPTATKVDYWDYTFLSNRIKRSKLAFDHEVIKEYFPYETVLSELLAITELLFDVRVEEVKNAKIWAPGVQLFVFREASDGSIILGEFAKKDYLDPALGKKLRTLIFEPGGMQDPTEMLKAFLGREPNSDAFNAHLGVQ